MKEFRVWDSKAKQYAMAPEYFINGWGELLYWDMNTRDLLEAEHCAVEFWTGLTDSEGVKIFDKDKLHLGIDFVGYVEMIDGSWRLISENPMHGRDVLFQDKAKHFTVIGTIHEDEK